MFCHNIPIYSEKIRQISGKFFGNIWTLILIWKSFFFFSLVFYYFRQVLKICHNLISILGMLANGTTSENWQKELLLGTNLLKKKKNRKKVTMIHFFLAII
jgi:hypothetical protein